METINQQLNIRPTNRNSNIRSKMARGANDYQVQLGTEDPSLDFYNDIQSISNYHNANGWSDVPDIDSSDYDYLIKKDNEFSNFIYPACVKLECKNCKNECKTVQGLKWRDGGKECYQSCRLNAKNEQMDRIRGLDSSNVVKSGEIIEQEAAPAGMGMGTKVAIGIGLLAVVGLTVYMIRKRKG